jgi:hypothetical protein
VGVEGGFFHAGSLSIIIASAGAHAKTPARCLSNAVILSWLPNWLRVVMMETSPQRVRMGITEPGCHSHDGGFTKPPG